VVGDILLDVVVRLDGLIQPDTDTYGHAVVGAGGQAANVAAWIAALGGSAALVSRHLIRQELRRHGVILHSPPAAPSTEPSSAPRREGQTGTVVSVATPDGRRTMLTDRGVTADLRPDKLDPAWFEGCDWHLPAHSLARSPLREATLALAARLPKLPVSVDYSSVIQALGVARFRELVVSLRPAVTFANHHKADLVGPSLSRRAPASAWSSSERAAVWWTAACTPPALSGRSTPPAPVTPSPPAGSSTPLVQVRWIQVATDGTPSWSTRNSMYQPGGARFGLAGTLAWSESLALATISRSTRRWPLSKEWVVTPFLISEAHRIPDACGVGMVMVWP
jgi:hypothetical protein